MSCLSNRIISCSFSTNNRTIFHLPHNDPKKQSVKEDTGWSTRPGYWRLAEQFLFPLHTRFLFKFPASTTKAAVPAAPRRFPRAEIKVKQHQLWVTSRLLVTNCNGLLQHKQLSYPFPGESEDQLEQEISQVKPMIWTEPLTLSPV